MSQLREWGHKIQKTLGIANKAKDAPTFQAMFERAIQEGAFDDYVVEKAKARDVESRLKLHKTGSDIGSFYSQLFGAVRGVDKNMPPHGDPSRDNCLAEFWKNEPILSGAVYSMAAKMTALRWTVTGRKNLASHYARMWSAPVGVGANGMNWGSFISPTAQDFYALNRGVFWNVERDGSSQTAPLSEVGYVDGLCCILTGNSNYPVEYWSDVTGQHIRYQPGEYIHFNSLPSGREMLVGNGFCAVDRAYRAAKLLLGLHQYDEQKLDNLPPEGIAAISGLTMDEFQDALALWQAAKKKNNSLTFPQVLWLLGSQPGSEVKLAINGFSQFPESFNREIVVVQYVNILALDFGVDAREFWPVSTSSLGTAAESEIQHMKARGKGPGELISTIEREINAEMPDGVVFAFDTQDIDEDLKAAEIAKGWIAALLPLTKAGGATEEVLTKDQLLRLLADRNIIPNYMVSDDRAVVMDSTVQLKEAEEYGEEIIYKWERGIITPYRPPAYNVHTTIIDAEIVHEDTRYARLKQAELAVMARHRNIRGKALPEREGVRGAAVTDNSVELEIERWRNNPLLAPYVPTMDEPNVVEAILANVKG